LVGEERFPDCPQGETAWSFLQTYREGSHPPVYEEYMAQKKRLLVRKDSGQ
jgi:hypothetical protein